MPDRGEVKRPGGVPLIAVALLAILLSAMVVRNAAVAEHRSRPTLAASLWPSHPTVLTDKTLLAIAQAAARNGPVSRETRSDVAKIAARAPLSPDPFLIEGALAATKGQDAKAERLFIEARARDPRSRGARYLLAQRYFETGRVTDGLVEMYALINLQDKEAEPFVPALVAYARTPGAIPQLRAFFEKHPRIEPAVLAQLALDPANADVVLALATNARNPDPDWRRTLLTSLAQAGQYERAYAIWARLTGESGGRGLYNPSFAKTGAPVPFAWSLSESAEGVSEADGMGGLDVLYYGRSTTTLASQLLLLNAGIYRLSMNVEAGDDSGTVHWVLRCLPVNKPIADLKLHAGRNSGQFSIPGTCQAQSLELVGVAADSPDNTQLTIRNLKLEKIVQ